MIGVKPKILNRGFLATLINLRESPVGLIGAAIVLFWVVMAVFAPLIAPYDPLAIQTPFAKPGTAAPDGGLFLFGTDQKGRDVLSRIIWGSRTVLIYAPLATFCAYIVGIAMGLAAGYRRGWVDIFLSRMGDIILSFPVLILYIIAIQQFGRSNLNIVIAIIFASAPGIMRIVRGLTLEIREREYIAAAQVRGEPNWWVMIVEILPNARGPLIVDSCLRVGYVIITIGILGFLGLGLPPPDPEWGGMINQGRQVALMFPHMTLFPAIALSTLVLGFNLMADGLRETSLKD